MSPNPSNEALDLSPVTVDDFSYGVNLSASPPQIPVGGAFNLVNFHPRSFGLERKSGYRFVSNGVTGQDAGLLAPELSSRGIATVAGDDTELGIDPDSNVIARQVYSASRSASSVNGALSRRNPDTGALELYTMLGQNMYLLTYLNGNWSLELLTDGTDPADVAVDLGRPRTLWEEGDNTIPAEYISDRAVSFAWFRGEVWIARRGFRMKRYRPTTGLFYQAPANAPRPGVLVAYEGFLMAADLGSHTYQDSDGQTVSVPEDTNGIRWSARFNASQWDDAESVTAGFKIPSQCPSRILSACPLPDELLFFHEDEVHSQRFVAGTEIFRTRQVTDSTGIFGRKTLVCSLNSVLWIGKDNIYFYGGDEVVPIDSDRRIRDELFLLDPGVIAKSVAYYDHRNQEIYWFFPAEEPLAYVYNVTDGSWTQLAHDNRFLTRFPVLFIDLPISPENNFHFLAKNGSVYDVLPSENTEAGEPFTSLAEFMYDLGTRKTKTLYNIELSVKGSGDLTVGYAALNNSEVDPNPHYTEQTISIDGTNPKVIPSISCKGAVGRFFAIRLITRDNLLIRSFSLRYNLEGLTVDG